MSFACDGINVQRVTCNGVDLQSITMDGVEVWNNSLLTKIRYDASSNYGISDLKGNVWRPKNGTKLTSGTGPFTDTSAFLIDAVNDKDGFILLAQASDAIKNKSFPNITICTWIKIVDCTAYYGDKYSFIFATAESSQKGYGIGFSITNNILKVQNVYSNFTEANAQLSDKWHYMEFSYEGTYLRAFLDGKMLISKSFYRATDKITVSNETVGTVIGNWFGISNANNRMKAYLYDYSIFNGIWHTKDYNVPTSPVSCLL